MTLPRLGRIGVWSIELRFGDPLVAAEAAAELDALGYGALWFPGGHGGDITGDIDRLLAATSRVTIGTGILNIWCHEPEDIAAWWQALPADHQSRVLVGLGVSHSEQIGEVYQKPLSAMRAWVERATLAGIPADSLCLAALAPKMLALSGSATAGTHPYLATPEHTALCRAAVGPGKLVAPEQGVILESDPAQARALARKALETYTFRQNYRNNWLRLGFSDEDIDTVSDRLVDALFAWGSAEQIAERVNLHFAAGADHVCLQVIHGGGIDASAVMPQWRELAGVLV